MCVISRRSKGYLFVAWRSRGVPLFDKHRFQLLVIKPFRIVKHMVFPNYLRAFQKRVGALLRLVGLPRAVFKATTKNTDVRRDWRSVWGPFWPKWAWHSRGVHILKKLVFSMFFKNPRRPWCFAVLRGLLALSGHPLGGFRGPNNQTKDTATLRPAVPRVLRLRAGGQGNTRPRNTTDRRAESLRRDRCVFKNPCKIQGFRAFWHPLGSKTAVKHILLSFLRAAVSPTKTPPKGISAKPL